MAVSDYDPLIQDAAREWNIDPTWIKAIMQQESGGNRVDRFGRPITSTAGAGGLMQIMPGTARDLGVEDVHDPMQAIYGGAKYLSQLLDKYGNPIHASMAYDAGPNRVDAYLSGKAGLPNETKAYIPAVSAHYQRFAKVDQPMAGPRTAAAKPPPPPSDVPSDEDFLKATGTVAKSPDAGGATTAAPNAAPGIPSDDDFLKMTGAAPPKSETVMAETPNDISGQGRDQYGNPVSPLAQASPSETDGAPIVRALSSGQGMRNALMPEPGYVRAPIPLLPLAWKETTPGSGEIDPKSGWSGLKFDPGAAIAPLVNPVLDLLEGTGLETSMGGPNAPLAGKVSPAATMLMLGARVGNPNPLQPRASIMSPLGRDIQLGAPEARLPSPGDLRIAPLSPEFMANPLTADARTAVTSQTPFPGAPATQTGMPLVARPGEAGTPLNAVPPMPREVVPNVGLPTTSAEAKQIAGAYYKKADDAGGTLSPDFTNKFIDRVESAAPQTSEGQIVAGENPVTKLVDRMQALRDNPISLSGVQEIDEGLGNLIDKEYGPRGLSKDGKNLQDLQTTFRNMIQDAGPSDITGGKEGFAALSDARKAWSQAMKMSDLERIVTRAGMTDNPATGIKSGIRTLLSNPARSRGYSPEEISALKAAADRGVLGGALHVFGSRLIPLAAGGAAFGASTGFLPAMAVAGATHLGSSLLRSGATRLQSRRMQNALSTLGSGVPPAP